jgi:hypothetical protein
MDVPSTEILMVRCGLEPEAASGIVAGECDEIRRGQAECGGEGVADSG